MRPLNGPRLPTLVAISMLAVALAGCTINCSPIHSNLSTEDLDGRVAERFHKGMLADDVRVALRRAGLSHRAAPVPWRPHLLGDAAEELGIQARVLPRGLVGIGKRMFSGGQLVFWFNKQEQLEAVAYQPLTPLFPFIYRQVALRER